MRLGPRIRLRRLVSSFRVKFPEAPADAPAWFMDARVELIARLERRATEFRLLYVVAVMIASVAAWYGVTTLHTVRRVERTICQTALLSNHQAEGRSLARARVEAGPKRQLDLDAAASDQTAIRSLNRAGC